VLVALSSPISFAGLASPQSFSLSSRHARRPTEMSSESVAVAYVRFTRHPEAR
jgi:hypothetical protein